MARTIWKYVLQRGWQIPLELPRNAQYLHLHQQNDRDVSLWFLADTEEPKVTRYFTAVEAGGTAPPPAAKYLGTAHLQSGSLVVHVFEVAGGDDVQYTLF